MPTTDSLDLLLMRVAAGDRTAFESLYDRVIDLVYGLARRVVVDAHIAREVAQEVMLEIWSSASGFDPQRGSAMSWIATMTRRRAIDAVRSTAASRRREQNDPPMPGASDPVAEQVVDGESRRRVRDALENLSDLQREAIDLAFFGGLTHRQVADQLDVPLGTVKTRIRDGLSRLAQAMGDSGG